MRATGALASNEAEAIVAATVAGRGIMLGNDWLVNGQLASGELVEILPEWTTEERIAIQLIFPSARFVPAKTRAFADWLTTLFSPIPPWRVIANQRTAIPRKRTRKTSRAEES